MVRVNADITSCQALEDSSIYGLTHYENNSKKIGIKGRANLICPSDSTDEYE
jgi:hypothetical protein